MVARGLLQRPCHGRAVDFRGLLTGRHRPPRGIRESFSITVEETAKNGSGILSSAGTSAIIRAVSKVVLWGAKLQVATLGRGLFREGRESGRG